MFTFHIWAWITSSLPLDGAAMLSSLLKQPMSFKVYSARKDQIYIPGVIDHTKKWRYKRFTIQPIYLSSRTNLLLIIRKDIVPMLAHQGCLLIPILFHFLRSQRDHRECYVAYPCLAYLWQLSNFWSTLSNRTCCVNSKTCPAIYLSAQVRKPSFSGIDTVVFSGVFLFPYLFL